MSNKITVEEGCMAIATFIVIFFLFFGFVRAIHSCCNEIQEEVERDGLKGIITELWEGKDKDE